MPKSAKDKITTGFKLLIEELRREKSDHYFASQLSSLIDFMHSEDRTDLIPVFKTNAAALDKLRKESLFEACPELKQFLS